VFFIWGQSEKRNRDVVVELSPGEDTVEGLGGVTGD